MRNIRLVIAYNGAAYSGWQIQPSVPTVQGAIEQSLQQMTGTHHRLRAAGRTDAGVHAEGQLANFSTESSIGLQAFHRGLNALTPDDVTIRQVAEVPPDFDSRRHNRGKRYRYTVVNERFPDPRLLPSAWAVHRPLDLAQMALGGQRLVGQHDFAAFRAASCERETTVRTLYRCSVSREATRISIVVEGTAFLKNMVRIIAGTLVEVGAGKRRAETIIELLQSGDRTAAGPTAPAQGLTLERVFL